MSSSMIRVFSGSELPHAFTKELAELSEALTKELAEKPFPNIEGRGPSEPDEPNDDVDFSS